MLTMITGDPGAGKTYLALSIAADLSNGKLPNGQAVEPASTLYLTNENPTAEVMRPRFDLLGGNPARLFLLRGTLYGQEGKEQRAGITLADISILDAAISENNVRLVVVDPIQSYLGAGVDLHRSNETRPIMDGLAKLAEKHACAMVLLRHPTKQTGGKAIHRGLGSIDLTGAVRSEMLAGTLPDEPGTRAFVHIKSNVGQLGHSLGYTISDSGFAWTGESTITAGDLLAAPSAPGDRKLAEANQWLTEQLRLGSMEQKQIRELANNAGISYATLRRAKKALQVRDRKAGMSGPWMWSLPEGAHDPPEDAQETSVSTFAELSTFDSDCGGVLQ
jgi:hypothetical protein